MSHVHVWGIPECTLPPLSTIRSTRKRLKNNTAFIRSEYSLFTATRRRMNAAIASLKDPSTSDQYAHLKGKDKGRYVFSDLIRFEVCGFLAPPEILIVSELDKEWQSTCRIDSIWLRHIEGLWLTSSKSSSKPKQYNNPHYGVKVRTLLDRVKDVPLANLKKALAQVNTGRCLEKADWRQMLIAKLVFARLPHIYAAAEELKHRPLYYTDWCLKVPVGKSTYYHAVKESRRDFVLKSELVNIKWKFQFKRAQDAEGNIINTETLPEGDVRAYESSFFDDYTMISESHQEVMTWTMHTSGIAGDKDAIVTVQVESYPVLRISRLKDNRFRMENEYVYFTQSTHATDYEVPII